MSLWITWDVHFLSTLNLTKGYWQIPLRHKDREKTAFLSLSGLHQFTKIPFGLHGAVATFQRQMDKVLQPVMVCVMAHIDDITVFSNSWDEHLVHLTWVLQCLRKAGLTANPQNAGLAGIRCVI